MHSKSLDPKHLVEEQPVPVHGVGDPLEQRLPLPSVAAHACPDPFASVQEERRAGTLASGRCVWRARNRLYA